MPTRADAERYRRTIVVIVVATLTWIVVAATIVRARHADANAYPAGAGVKADLRHCRRGGQHSRCSNKTNRELSHDGPPLEYLVRKTLEEKPRSTACAIFGRRFRAKINEQILRKLWNKLRFDRYACCSAHSAATRKSCGASSCSGLLPLSQDWKRSR